MDRFPWVALLCRANAKACMLAHFRSTLEAGGVAAVAAHDVTAKAVDSAAYCLVAAFVEGESPRPFELPNWWSWRSYRSVTDQ